MSCSCIKNRPTRPVETCIFCAHKHISTACALFPETADDFRNSLIAGQLNCAALHYNDAFPEMRDGCRQIIDRIHDFEAYGAMLSALRDAAWSLVLNHQNDRRVFNKKDILLPLPIETNLTEGHLAIATSKALYDLELSYRGINKSDAMGYLIIGAWHLQEKFLPLALKCRNLWGKIEHLRDCGEELTALEREVWNRICDQNKTVLSVSKDKDRKTLEQG